MPEFAIVSFAVRLLYLVITLVVAVLFLRWFDRSLNINFRKDVWDVLVKDPVALAVYHGFRLLAVLLLAGQFLS